MRQISLPVAVVLAVALPASHGRADDTITVTLDTMNDHENVKGTVVVKEFTIKGKHGTMVVPAAKVKDFSTTSRFTEEGHVLRVTTVDEQVFEGVIVAPRTLDIAGKYGRFSTGWDDVFALKVEGSPDVPDREGKVSVWNVRIEATSGDRLSGTLYSVVSGPIDGVEIDCELGSLTLEAKKVRSIRFDPGAGEARDGGETHKAGSIVTADGGELTGTITVPSDWVMDTPLGFLGIKADKLKCITFEGAAGLPDARTPCPVDQP